MKRCDLCGSALKHRRTTRDEPYAYTIGGLPHVGLVGIGVYRCAACDAESPVIPKPGELHRVLVRLFLHQPRLLTGNELRFIRKHAGLSAQTFAQYLAVDPSHLSRVENGKTESLGETSDRLARAIVSAVIDSKLFKDVLARIAESGQTVRRPLVKMKNNRWSEEQVA
jgi:transcriptional regulator with XRE-family HTH domain